MLPKNACVRLLWASKVRPAPRRVFDMPAETSEHFENVELAIAKRAPREE